MLKCDEVDDEGLALVLVDVIMDADDVEHIDNDIDEVVDALIDDEVDEVLDDLDVMLKMLIVAGLECEEYEYKVIWAEQVNGMLDDEVEQKRDVIVMCLLIVDELLEVGIDE